MMDSNEKLLSTEAEDALLNDDYDSKVKTPTTAHQDHMFSMIQYVKKTSERLLAWWSWTIDLNRLHPSNITSQWFFQVADLHW